MVTHKSRITCTFVLTIFFFAASLRNAVGVPPPATAPTAAGDVTGARVIATTSLTIKPCASVTVIVEVDLAHAISEKERRRLLGRLSGKLTINDNSYRNLRTDSSRLNDVAMFRLIPVEAKNSGIGVLDAMFRFAVTFFLNTKDRTCVFLDPGDYSIELLSEYVPVNIDVHVEETTAEEAAVIEKLADLEVLLFLVDPEDRQHATPKVLALLEDLRQRSAVHSKMLSLALGIGRLATQDFRSMQNDEMKVNIQDIYGLLNEHCNGPLISELDELAAYKCGLVANMLARLEQDETRAHGLRERRDELWDKVRRSHGLSESARQMIQTYDQR